MLYRSSISRVIKAVLRDLPILFLIACYLIIHNAAGQLMWIEMLAYPDQDSQVFLEEARLVIVYSINHWREDLHVTSSLKVIEN